jgi:hypothetical protein
VFLCFGLARLRAVFCVFVFWGLCRQGELNGQLTYRAPRDRPTFLANTAFFITITIAVVAILWTLVIIILDVKVGFGFIII